LFVTYYHTKISSGQSENNGCLAEYALRIALFLCPLFIGNAWFFNVNLFLV